MHFSSSSKCTKIIFGRCATSDVASHWEVYICNSPPLRVEEGAPAVGCRGAERERVGEIGLERHVGVITTFQYIAARLRATKLLQ